LEPLTAAPNGVFILPKMEVFAMTYKRKTNGKAGRPTILTEELQAQFAALLLEGNYIETAAAVCGLPKQTIFDWLKRGAHEEIGIYKEFSDSVKSAMAESEANDLRAIMRHGIDDWKAHAWRLERRFPAKWGRKDHLTAEIDSTHTERTEAIFEHQISSDPETRELLKQLHRRQQAQTHDTNT
jgi:transposase